MSHSSVEHRNSEATAKNGTPWLTTGKDTSISRCSYKILSKFLLHSTTQSRVSKLRPWIRDLDQRPFENQESGDSFCPKLPLPGMLGIRCQGFLAFLKLKHSCASHKGN